ncbi:hypothetical protein CBM2637_B10117 [Cupriavidus taiwanensis]|nr:hypothetical protein CBM2637_B10117 [Cupriavidus taiwanensis]
MYSKPQSLSRRNRYTSDRIASGVLASREDLVAGRMVADGGQPGRVVHGSPAISYQ